MGGDEFGFGGGEALDVIGGDSSGKGVSSTPEDMTMNEKPAAWRISARRGEVEARMSFMRDSGGEEYYSASAATAWALVRPRHWLSFR